MAKDFVKVEPISSPPIRPGPQVAENKSISRKLNPESSNAFFVIFCSISKWALEANSGTTPPCFL